MFQDQSWKPGDATKLAAFHKMAREAQQEADDILLDDVFGTVVVWEYEGCPHYGPRQQLEGVIVDVRTKRGERQVLVKAQQLNLPKWVNVQDVQFISNKTAAAA